MENYYKTLGINSSATQDEIRRAYRILARRYHPDVNPGKTSEEKFKTIAQAYDTLSDPERRRSYDAEFETTLRNRGSAAEQAYRRAAQAAAHAEAHRRFNENKFQNFGKVSPETNKSKVDSSAIKKPTPQINISKLVTDTKTKLDSFINSLPKWKKSLPSNASNKNSEVRTSKISIVEVSVTIREALLGGRKSVEIAEPEGTRKVSVNIPAGARSGSVLRLRSTNSANEELVVILRVASHPLVSILPKGVVIEIPITINEAISGANISVPTFEEPASLKVPSGTQSGQEIRIKGKGVLSKSGERGDIFYKLMIKVPESANAIGLAEKSNELEKYYGSGIRSGLIKSLAEV